MQTTIYISPDGAEHRSLPRTWGNATNITEPWALAHGWTKTSREEPDPVPPPARYSQYRLHQALEAAGVWEPFWAALTPSQRQFWNEAQDLAADDPNFLAGLAALDAAVNQGDFGLPEGETIDAILEAAQV